MPQASRLTLQARNGRVVLLVACSLWFVASCVPSTPTVRRPSFFSDLVYSAAAQKYKAEMEQRYKAQDISYLLPLLNYGITSFYGRDWTEARKALTAGYRIDEGNVSEAAKFYQWLVVDSRRVYKLAKRERELVHLYLGLTYIAEDNLPEALVEFKKLRLRDQEASSLPVVNFYMGWLYEKLGKYDDALLEYRPLVGTAVGFQLDADGLVSRVESLKAGVKEPPSPLSPPQGGGNEREGVEMVELVVHVDHQEYDGLGQVRVLADGESVATIAPGMDRFEVKLTSGEQARKDAQEATASATRAGLRCCGVILGELLWPRHGADMADFAADVALGKEDENRDVRFWGYAPVGISVLRTKVPVGTREVKLEFENGNGGYVGSCVYPLAGDNRRSFAAAGTQFIVAGLAKEFYAY